jgi:hypothetical protein
LGESVAEEIQHVQTPFTPTAGNDSQDYRLLYLLAASFAW